MRQNINIINMNKIAIIFFCLTFPLAVMGQGKIEREGKTSKEQRANNKPATNTQTLHIKTTPINLSLACDSNGVRRYYTEREWKKLPTDKKVQLNKVGLIVKYGNDEFLMSLKELPKWSSWEVAKVRTDNQMPTKNQWQIIKRNRTKINDALYAFGGGFISSRRWWNSGNAPSWTVMFCDGTEYDKASPSKSNEEAGVWLATNDIEHGFREVTITKSYEQNYDFIGTESNSKLRVIRHKAKYGFINQTGDIVVPIKYDELGCGYINGNISGNDEVEWYSSSLMSVSQNGKWGYINKNGKVVVPLIFDRVQTASKGDNTPIWVSKNGLYGCIDTLGNYVIPLIYEDEIHFYNFINVPSRAKKNGKWGFVHKNGEVAIQFKYDSTRGFGDGDLAQVSLNNKYGFINIVGDIVLPIKYEFADDFHSGLAGVVVNGKVGFLDLHGNIVIPCMYDIEYSFDGNGKKLGLGMSFWGGIAFVKKGNKYAIIDKSGKFITNFKYDKISSRGSYGYSTVSIGNKIFYLDKGGNEYNSIQERNEKSDSILANQGYPYEQFRMGKKDYKQKNYMKAYTWFVNSAKGGDSDGQCHLGYYYYYGYEPVKENRKEAFRLFSLAAEKNNTEACYFLGWMYEHGQYVATNKTKAIEWYKKSNGQRDSEKRIETLSR